MNGGQPYQQHGGGNGQYRNNQPNGMGPQPGFDADGAPIQGNNNDGGDGEDSAEETRFNN